MPKYDIIVTVFFSHILLFMSVYEEFVIYKQWATIKLMKGERLSQHLLWKACGLSKL